MTDFRVLCDAAPLKRQLRRGYQCRTRDFRVLCDAAPLKRLRRRWGRKVPAHFRVLCDAAPLKLPSSDSINSGNRNISASYVTRPH